MGGLSGKNRAPANDPFYRSIPPATGDPTRIAPGGGLTVYDPAQEYGYEYRPTAQLGRYGGPTIPRSDPYGGRYAQGLNQIPGVSPWNYGNYYLGNTTMRMMPMMLNKVHEYGQIQARALLGNAGLLSSTPAIPNAPIMPCYIPPLFSLSRTAPMMAAATPLPVAFNPLVQGMYPMASMSPVNWMTPSSFMSALSAGPMPYRPPAFDFPSNVGMVMTIPYGTPNPWLSAPPFSGFSSSCNFGGISSAPVLPPASYYSQPGSIRQTYSAPYPVSVPTANAQQVPAQQLVSAVAPPIVAGGYQLLAAPCGASSRAPQPVLTNSCCGRSAAMASNHHLTMQTPIRSQQVNGSSQVYNPIDQCQHFMREQVTSSLTGCRSNNNQHPGITPSAAKNVNQNRDTFFDHFRRYLPSIFRFSPSNYKVTRTQPPASSVLPPILHGQLISDSGWLLKDVQYQTIAPTLDSKNQTRSFYALNIGEPVLNGSNSRISSNPHPRHRHSSSSTSTYDCIICQQQREKRRLRGHYNSSTVTSLLSSPKNQRKQRLSSGELTSRTPSRTPIASKQNSSKSHRRHPVKLKTNNRLSPSKQPTSPVSPQQAPIQEQEASETTHEDEGEPGLKLQLESDSGQGNVEKTSALNNESAIKNSDQYESKISLISIDEETASNN